MPRSGAQEARAAGLPWTTGKVALEFSEERAPGTWGGAARAKALGHEAGMLAAPGGDAWPEHSVGSRWLREQASKAVYTDRGFIMCCVGECSPEFMSTGTSECGLTWKWGLCRGN